jgi:hypothetical protein
MVNHSFSSTGSAQMSVRIVVLPPKSDAADIYLRPGLDQIAGGDDLALLRELPRMFAEDAAIERVTAVLRGWVTTLSPSVRRSMVRSRRMHIGAGCVGAKSGVTWVLRCG